MRRLAQTPEVQFNTQPSVVSRPGQSGTVEVVREVILPQAVEADGNLTFQTDWTGFQMQVDSGQYGFDLQSHIRHESRDMIGASPDSIEAQVASSTDVLPSGQTGLIESTSPAGAHRYLFVTTQRVDATGRPFDPRGEDQ